VDSQGKWPCHLSVHPSGKFVLVANYDTGNVSVFPILANGGLGDPTDTESDTGALNPPKAADNPPGNFAPAIIPGRRCT
jgi:6-phosphogluconolactonase